MGVCTLVLINLIIAYATRIYDEADDDVTPEHRSNLVKLYEYLRWDENYGLFKFLFAPFNVIQLPFSIFIEDDYYHYHTWGNINYSTKNDVALEDSAFATGSIASKDYSKTNSFVFSSG